MSVEYYPGVNADLKTRLTFSAPAYREVSDIVTIDDFRRNQSPDVPLFGAEIVMLSWPYFEYFTGVCKSSKLNKLLEFCLEKNHKNRCGADLLSAALDPENSGHLHSDEDNLRRSELIVLDLNRPLFSGHAQLRLKAARSKLNAH